MIPSGFHPLAFPHGPFAGPQYRLEDVVEHRFLAGEDVDLGHHAGDDRQRILGIAEMTAIGAHPNLVEALALLVDDRVGADVFEFGFQRTVLRKIIGCNFWELYRKVPKQP